MNPNPARWRCPRPSPIKPLLWLLACAWAAAPQGRAEALKLQTELYVFRASAFRAIRLPGAGASDRSRGLLFQSPWAAQFDHIALLLNGPRFVWQGRGGPTDPFRQIAALSVALPAGQAVTVQASAGAAPARCRLTFTAAAAPSRPGLTALACEIDLATALGTQPGAGAGLPPLAVFRQNVAVSVRDNAWCALLLPEAGGGDASLLLLAKVAPDTDPVPLLTKVDTFHLLTARFGASVVGDDRYVYVIGGENEGGNLTDIERFDVVTHATTRLTNRLLARNHQGAALVEGKLYIFGGRQSNGGRGRTFEEQLEIFHVATGRLSRGRPMPRARENFATAVLEGKIYALGGVEGDGLTVRQTGRVSVYDPRADRWTDALPLPLPLSTRSAVVANGCILLSGGQRFPTNSGVKDVEYLDPRKHQWLSLPDLSERVVANAAAVLGHTLYLFGNYDAPDHILAYDLGTNASVAFKGGFAPASQTSAVRVGDRIYVVGGTSGGGRQWNGRRSMDDIQVFAQER